VTAGIWPSGHLRAFRDGDMITIETEWADSDSVKDGRTARSAAQTICAPTINDLQGSGESVPRHIDVLARDEETRLRVPGGDGMCQEEP